MESDLSQGKTVLYPETIQKLDYWPWVYDSNGNVWLLEETDVGFLDCGKLK